jgi:hypothetical protein
VKVARHENRRDETKGLDDRWKGRPTTNGTGPLTLESINTSNGKTGSCPLSVVKAMTYRSLTLGASPIARLHSASRLGPSGARRLTPPTTRRVTRLARS